MITDQKREVDRIWFDEYFTKGNLELLDQLTDSHFIFHSRNTDNPKNDMREFMN